MYEIVVACNQQMVIGKDNTIPWKIKEDLRMFQELTTNHIVVMGRKTYESLPIKPLKNRYNIVLTSNPDKYVSKHENLAFTNMENVSNIIENQTKKWGEQVFIIGGSDIYRYFLDKCDKLHITMIDKEVDGDTFFPCSIYDLENRYGFTLKKCGNKVLSKTDTCLFQYRTYIKN